MKSSIKNAADNAACNWPDIPERYLTALKAAASFVLSTYDSPIGVIAADSFALFDPGAQAVRSGAAPMSIGYLILFCFAVCTGFCFSFLPVLVALARGHRKTGAVLILNILVGWTILGWAFVLLWALDDGSALAHARRASLARRPSLAPGA